MCQANSHVLQAAAAAQVIADLRQKLSDCEASRDSLLFQVAGLHRQLHELHAAAAVPGTTSDGDQLNDITSLLQPPPLPSAQPRIQEAGPQPDPVSAGPVVAAEARELAEAQAEIARLRIQLEDARRPSPLADETPKLREALQRAEREVERLRTHLVTEEEAREAREAEVEELQAQWRSRLAEADDVRRRFGEVQAEAEARRQEAAELAGEVRRHAAAVANLERLVEQLQAEQEAATGAEVRHLRAQLAATQQARDAAAAQAALLPSATARTLALEEEVFQTGCITLSHLAAGSSAEGACQRPCGRRRRPRGGWAGACAPGGGDGAPKQRRAGRGEHRGQAPGSQAPAHPP